MESMEREPVHRTNFNFSSKLIRGLGSTAWNCLETSRLSSYSNAACVSVHMLIFRQINDIWHLRIDFMLAFLRKDYKTRKQIVKSCALLSPLPHPGH